MKNTFSLLFILALNVLLIFLLSSPIGPLPPAGTFFQPAFGFWANAEKFSTNQEITLNFGSLNEPVNIFFDERNVPHIFAMNDEDLYFAQGYITARDRLFQMELQVRAAAGMLSEWLGPDLVEYDLHQRRLGMMYGAERAMELISQNDTSRIAINSYAEGVNAYINTLTYESYPLEYKILDIKPSEWKPLNTALLLKYMTQMLAGRSEDFRTSNTVAHFGHNFADRYLSSRPDLMDPIIPPEKIWPFDPLETTPPDSLYRPTYTNRIDPWEPDPLNGSNNWVLDGSKTAAGYPILSNDMHLNMSMPAIWYEIQLRTPDFNVYGVTLQGAPTVIVGFNEHIAWGSTNAGADVMDWYEINFRNDQRSEYLHDGQWKPVTKRVETILVKEGESVNDTIRFTHHGPVYKTEEETPTSETIQRDHALRWIAHDPSSEILTFYRLNRARGYEDFRDAFRSYFAPAQNMNYAGTDGNIAMQMGGRFPLKWTYQGRTVSDGSDPRYDWEEFIPFEHNPYALNPERGFLSAANQYPAAENYPYYLGESFAPYERGRRINDLLREMDSVTTSDLQEMFMDNFSYHAGRLLPVLLEVIDSSLLTPEEADHLEVLRSWNYHNEAELVAPSIFREWWRELYDSIWANKYDAEYPMRWPDRDITSDLIINEQDSQWFDNAHTNVVETLPDLVQISYRSALQNLSDRYGEHGDSWKWGYVNNTDLNHVGQIPGLGIKNVFTGGGAESINAIRGSHGPSWRMLVELDPNGVRAYGVYPGGQSGNPGSKTYDEFVETWRTGELYELLFLREKPENIESYPLVIRFE